MQIADLLFFEYKVNDQYQEHKAYGMIPSKGFVFKKKCRANYKNK